MTESVLQGELIKRFSVGEFHVLQKCYTWSIAQVRNAIKVVEAKLVKREVAICDDIENKLLAYHRRINVAAASCQNRKLSDGPYQFHT